MRTSCPEALHGQHGDPNTNGNCPYCGERIAPRRSYSPRRSSRSLPEAELDHALRRAQVEVGGHVSIPREQDPSIDEDESEYWES